jgi:hypothetical protein
MEEVPAVNLPIAWHFVHFLKIYLHLKFMPKEHPLCEALSDCLLLSTYSQYSYRSLLWNSSSYLQLVFAFQLSLQDQSSL